MNAYQAICLYYKDQTAKRSGVPLIKHIDEGLRILEKMGATELVQNAYCVHPLFQDSQQLPHTLSKLGNLDIHPYSLVLVMEYRNQANRWLSDKVTRLHDEVTINGQPSPGPLPDVRLMLIADKVQNYKDFLQYHAKSHARALELEEYFQQWFNALEINWEDYV